MEIIPGIFESDVEKLNRRIALVAPHAEWIQLDIADNTFVPADSCHDAKILGSIIGKYPKNSFEAHLMVANPSKYVKPLADAGFKRLIAHIETNDPREFLDEAQYESVEIGLAIDAATELEQIEPMLDQIDLVLVMTIEAGASGQKLLPETLEKIKSIHENYPDLVIEVDGGINDVTVKLVGDMGASRAVSTSYIFADEVHIAKSIQNLTNA